MQDKKLGKRKKDSRTKVRTQVCKTTKSGKTKCKYKMVKRTPDQLKAYDEMKTRKAKGQRRLSDLDILYPVLDKSKKK